MSISCFAIRSLLLFDWLFEDRSPLPITATRIQRVRDPSLDMEVHGEQLAAILPICSVAAPYTLQTLDLSVLTSVLMKIGPWAKTISLILFHRTTQSGLYGMSFYCVGISAISPTNKIIIGTVYKNEIPEFCL